MSKMRIIVFSLAAGSAVMAGLLAKGFIGQTPDPVAPVVEKVSSVEVLVAAKDILVGEKISGGAVVWKDWPERNVLESMVKKTDENANADVFFAEFRSRVPMYEGETINLKKLVDPKNGGFMSAVLPKGMRAVSVVIRDSSSAGGFILPNDRVDVIITRKVTGAELHKSETFISNVRVLAINQTFRTAKEDGEEVAIKGETATLEMSLAQAEVVARVEKEGELSLALRSIAESDGEALKEGPMLAEKYRGDGTNERRRSDTLFVRYGVETYAAGN
jgi:pilus assembly protein CpaB